MNTIFIGFAFALAAFALPAHAMFHCQGRAIIRTSVTNVHFMRDIHVSFSPDLNTCEHHLSLNDKFEAMVTIDIGGEPLVYEGPIKLDGVFKHQVNFAESSESVEFLLKRSAPDTIELQLSSFIIGDAKPLMYIAPFELRCQ
jgi:hypothetical protein